MKPKDGRDLEEAAALIQEAILTSDPRLKGTRFIVERRKIVYASGARHEIDVFVQTSPGSEYEATFIFECKDTADPVGVEAVHVLADKVETLRATRGFLVARQTTKDARALIESKPKLRYIRCSNEFTGPLFTATLWDSVREPVSRTVSFHFRGTPPSEHPTKLDWKGKPCRFRGQPADLRAILDPFFDRLVAEDTKKNDWKYAQEGTHPSTLSGHLDFQPGELLVDWWDVEYLEIQGAYRVVVSRKPARFKFELDGHGRVICFEPVAGALPGAALQVNIVQRL